ncbi:hypothetical protein ACPA9J_28415 [Pseudomonas aeruginosa]
MFYSLPLLFGVSNCRRGSSPAVRGAGVHRFFRHLPVEACAASRATGRAALQVLVMFIVMVG